VAPGKDQGLGFHLLLVDDSLHLHQERLLLPEGGGVGVCLQIRAPTTPRAVLCSCEFALLYRFHPFVRNRHPKGQRSRTIPRLL